MLVPDRGFSCPTNLSHYGLRVRIILHNLCQSSRANLWDPRGFGFRLVSRLGYACLAAWLARPEANSGGVSLEWMQEAGPTKFLVGSEHGIILSCTKRPKKQAGEPWRTTGQHFAHLASVLGACFVKPKVASNCTVVAYCAKLM